MADESVAGWWRTTSAPRPGCHPSPSRPPVVPAHPDRWWRWPNGRPGGGPVRCLRSSARRHRTGWSATTPVVPVAVAAPRRIRRSIRRERPTAPARPRRVGARWPSSTTPWPKRPTVPWCGWPRLWTPPWWYSSSSTGWDRPRSWCWPRPTGAPVRWPPVWLPPAYPWPSFPISGRRPPPEAGWWWAPGWRPGPPWVACGPPWCSTPTMRPTGRNALPPGRRSTWWWSGADGTGGRWS